MAYLHPQRASFTFAVLPKIEELASSQLCMQPFLLGHTLGFRIVSAGALGIVSIRIPAGL